MLRSEKYLPFGGKFNLILSSIYPEKQVLKKIFSIKTSKNLTLVD
jgi:hypothetical protein